MATPPAPRVGAGPAAARPPPRRGHAQPKLNAKSFGARPVQGADRRGADAGRRGHRHDGTDGHDRTDHDGTHRDDRHADRHRRPRPVTTGDRHDAGRRRRRTPSGSSASRRTRHRDHGPGRRQELRRPARPARSSPTYFKVRRHRRQGQRLPVRRRAVQRPRHQASSASQPDPRLPTGGLPGLRAGHLCVPATVRGSPHAALADRGGVARPCPARHPGGPARRRGGRRPTTSPTRWPGAGSATAAAPG